jgi:hypothetical protein
VIISGEGDGSTRALRLTSSATVLLGRAARNVPRSNSDSLFSMHVWLAGPVTDPSQPGGYTGPNFLLARPVLMSARGWAVAIVEEESFELDDVGSISLMLDT